MEAGTAQDVRAWQEDVVIPTYPAGEPDYKQALKPGRNDIWVQVALRGVCEDRSLTGEALRL